MAVRAGELVAICCSTVRGRHEFRPPRGTTGAAVLPAADGLFIRFAARVGYFGEGRYVGGGTVRHGCLAWSGGDPGGGGAAEDVHGAAAAGRGQLPLPVREGRAPRGHLVHARRYLAGGDAGDAGVDDLPQGRLHQGHPAPGECDRTGEARERRLLRLHRPSR
ncbi:hypothetical protein SGPA1_70035 [Streptomyces misionensis JCM 4497]